jgi:hypothetical protein
LTFLFRLAGHLKKTVGELLTGAPGPITATELDCWRAYRQRYGFDADRIEAAVANAGAAQCQAWGVRVRAEDLVPKFGPRAGLTGKALVAALAAIPGAKVEYVPHKKPDPEPQTPQLKA